MVWSYSAVIVTVYSNNTLIIIHHSQPRPHYPTMFQCQRDSYLQHSISRVISCEEATLGDIRGYEVVLEDTVLFPEGGGQVSKRCSSQADS